MSDLSKLDDVVENTTIKFLKSPSDSEDVTRSRKWYEWYEPGTSAEEKRLLLKLDFFILTFTSLSFFIKILDSSNVTNAYVSGMKVDLHLDGNQLNFFTTYYNIGIILGAPFITAALTKVSPGFCLPLCVILTSFFVLFMYKAENAETIYALRFFAGFFSAGVLPGAFYIVGSWYRRSEIARRSVISMISFYAGGMFSAYIQAGLHSGMEGRLGLASWRWLFIFDAIIGIPVAIFGFICLPNEPRAKRIWWITDAERSRAIERMTDDGRDAVQHFKFPSTVIQILKSWQFWCFPIGYALLNLTVCVLATQWMILYLQSTQMYSIVQTNAISTTVACAAILVTVCTGVIVDYIGSFVHVIFVLGLGMIFGLVVFVVWPDSNAFKIAMYIVVGASYSAIFPLIIAWANSVCGGNKYLRASTTAWMSTLGYALETVAQQEFFPASQAPKYAPTHGFVWSLCWTVAMMVWTCGVVPIFQAGKIRFRTKRDNPV